MFFVAAQPEGNGPVVFEVTLPFLNFFVDKSMPATYGLRRTGALLALTVFFARDASLFQAWPTACPLRIITWCPPGGGTDVLSRMVAPPSLSNSVRMNTNNQLGHHS